MADAMREKAGNANLEVRCTVSALAEDGLRKELRSCEVFRDVSKWLGSMSSADKVLLGRTLKTTFCNDLYDKLKVWELYRSFAQLNGSHKDARRLDTCTKLKVCVGQLRWIVRKVVDACASGIKFWRKKPCNANIFL